jgi:hypothetical protein
MIAGERRIGEIGTGQVASVVGGPRSVTRSIISPRFAPAAGGDVDLAQVENVDARLPQPRAGLSLTDGAPNALSVVFLSVQTFGASISNAIEATAYERTAATSAGPCLAASQSRLGSVPSR